MTVVPVPPPPSPAAPTPLPQSVPTAPFQTHRAVAQMVQRGPLRPTPSVSRCHPLCPCGHRSRLTRKPTASSGFFRVHLAPTSRSRVPARAPCRGSAGSWRLWLLVFGGWVVSRRAVWCFVDCPSAGLCLVSPLPSEVRAAPLPPTLPSGSVTPFWHSLCALPGPLTAQVIWAHTLFVL